jgi:acyl-CoA reductase-like NAD-dependent aldehyde dehydrogenase
MSVAIVDVIRRAIQARRPEERIDIFREIAERLREARLKLSKAVRDFWASPEGELVKTALSDFAYASGYAHRMELTMDKVRDEIRKNAKDSGIDFWYTLAWGKLEKASRLARR